MLCLRQPPADRLEHHQDVVTLLAKSVRLVPHLVELRHAPVEIHSSECTPVNAAVVVNDRLNRITLAPQWQRQHLAELLAIDLPFELSRIGKFFVIQAGNAPVRVPSLPPQQRRFRHDHALVYDEICLLFHFKHLRHDRSWWRFAHSLANRHLSELKLGALNQIPVADPKGGAFCTRWR